MFRKDDLARFVLQHVDVLEEGEEKGSGAYGVVHTVRVGGTKCIAKRIHRILHDREVPPRQQDFIRQKFRDECRMLSELRHPNIVHFVGVHYGRNKYDISLIMEALDTDLRSFIKKRPATPIPLPLKLGILLDVAYGLLYLHTRHPRAVIHRDLNLGNILLTQDLRAKIADLGVSRYLDMKKHLTTAPGSWDYMPPEALVENAKYDTALDIFSFGQVMLCVTIEKVLALTPSVSAGKCGHGNTEIKKRKSFLDRLGETHCLYSTVTQCLLDCPTKRPNASHLCDQLQKLCFSHPRTMVDILKVYSAGEQENDMLQSVPNSASRDCIVLEQAEEVAALRTRLEEVTREKKEQENLALLSREEASVYKEDFETERCDRADAHSRFEKEKEEHKFQLTKLQTQIAEQEAVHEEQIQEYYTKLEMKKAEMDKQKDNHLSIVQFMKNDIKHLRDQLEKEQLRNKRSIVPLPLTHIHISSATKESRSGDIKHSDTRHSTALSTLPRDFKHTYVNISQTLQENIESQKADVCHHMLQVPQPMHENVTKHSLANGRIHIYQRIPGTESDSDDAP